jgi:hypothetical protein
MADPSLLDEAAVTSHHPILVGRIYALEIRVAAVEQEVIGDREGVADTLY